MLTVTIEISKQYHFESSYFGQETSDTGREGEGVEISGTQMLDSTDPRQALEGEPRKGRRRTTFVAGGAARRWSARLVPRLLAFPSSIRAWIRAILREVLLLSPLVVAPSFSPYSCIFSPSYVWSQPDRPASRFHRMVCAGASKELLLVEKQWTMGT